MAGADEPAFKGIEGHGAAQMCAAPIDRQQAAIRKPDQVEAARFKGCYAARGKIFDRTNSKNSTELTFYHPGRQKLETYKDALAKSQSARRSPGCPQEIPAG